MLSYFGAFVGFETFGFWVGTGKVGLADLEGLKVTGCLDGDEVTGVLLGGANGLVVGF